MHKDLEKVLFTQEELAARVRELGEQITKDYEGKSLLLVCILKGAVTFCRLGQRNQACCRIRCYGLLQLR